MAHGQPDFGAYAPKKTVGSMADNAELAARLGSIVTYDRKGDVVFLDGFESGLSPYLIAGAGTGWSVTQSNEHSRNGGFSAKLVCGSNGVREARLHKHLPYPTLGNLGFEASFTLHADVEYVLFYLAIYDGTNLIEGQIQFDQDNSRLRYRNEFGPFTTIEDGLRLYEHNDMFNTLKFMVDFVNSNYVRVMLNERTWSLAGIPVNTSLSGFAPHIACNVYCRGVAAKNATIFVDDFIVTQNEP